MATKEHKDTQKYLTAKNAKNAENKLRKRKILNEFQEVSLTGL